VVQSVIHFPFILEFYGFEELVKDFGCPAPVADWKIWNTICAPSSPILSFVSIWGFILFMLIVSWYLDSVLTTNNGVGRPWLFFVTAEYWLPSRKENIHSVLEKYSQQGSFAQNQDVLNESNHAMSLELDDENAMRVLCLEKEFKSLTKKSVKAVRGVSIYGEKGSCVSILGHNGAGKS
jgi:ABC-type multidrug transport system fused ATPase/permease subunit